MMSVAGNGGRGNRCELSGRVFSGLALCAFLMAMAAGVQAEIVSTATNGAASAFSAATNDLLQMPWCSATLTSGQAMYSSSITMLYDGDLLGGEDPSYTAHSLTPSDGAAVTFALDVSQYTQGYSLTSVVSVTVYGSVFNIRKCQSYDLAVKYVGESSFTNLFSVSSNLANNVDATGIEAVRVATTNDAGGALATGVQEIRVTFHSVASESVYREIDIMGAPVNGENVIPSKAVNGVATNYSALTNDLLQTSLSSATLDGTAMYGSSLPKIYDGRLLGAGGVYYTDDSLTPSDGAIATFVLDTSKAAHGYTLSNVVSTTANNPVALRICQVYDLAVKYVGGSSFTNLFSVPASLHNNTTNIDIEAVQVTTPALANGPLASNVKEIQITFHNNPYPRESVFREFDVIGAPTPVPAGTIIIVR